MKKIRSKKLKYIKVVNKGQKLINFYIIECSDNYVYQGACLYLDTDENRKTISGLVELHKTYIDTVTKIYKESKKLKSLWDKQ